MARRGSKGIFMEKRLIKSEAWLSLNGTAMKMFLIFRLKCRMSKQGRQGKESWSVDNNSEIVFTYVEGLKTYGITRPRFARGLDELIGKGFIDIAKHGSGLKKDVTLYAISERWRLYGQEHFQTAERPKRKIHYGFTKAKRHRKKNLSTDDNVIRHVPFRGIDPNIYTKTVNWKNIPIWRHGKWEKRESA